MSLLDLQQIMSYSGKKKKKKKKPPHLHNGFNVCEQMCKLTRKHTFSPIKNKEGLKAINITILSEYIETNKSCIV